MLTHPTGWRIKVPISAVTILTLVAPEGGLIAIAMLAPIGMAVGMALIIFSQFLILSVLGGLVWLNLRAVASSSNSGALRLRM